MALLHQHSIGGRYKTGIFNFLSTTPSLGPETREVYNKNYLSFTPSLGPETREVYDKNYLSFTPSLGPEPGRYTTRIIFLSLHH